MEVVDANSSVMELLFCIVTEKLLWPATDLAPGGTVENETGKIFPFMDLILSRVLKPGFLEL